MTTSEWIECKLADACSSIDYGLTASATNSRVGPRFLRITDIVDGIIDWTSVPYVAADTETQEKFRLADGDIVLARTGASTGASVYIKEPPPALFASYLVRLKAKPEFDSRFLAYYLKSEMFWSFIRGVLGDKSAQPNASASTMTQAPLRAPKNIEAQRVIARILSSLDDKIELNGRMNETLESLARTIYTSWFSNFEPVRMSVNNLIVEKALEIGDGYRAKNDELGREGLPFIRAGNLNNGFDTSSADYLKPESVALALNKISRVGDVAFTSKGTIGRFARVGEATERFVYSPQICYWRSLDYRRVHPAVLYCWMQSDDFKNQVLAVAGQTDMAPYVSLKDQKRMSIPVFDDSQYEIGESIAPLLARQSLNDAESRTLSVLRDSLLPKLISGELPVPVGAAQ